MWPQPRRGHLLALAALTILAVYVPGCRDRRLGTLSQGLDHSPVVGQECPLSIPSAAGGAGGGEFLWDFGDGTTLTGPSAVSHAWTDPSLVDATLDRLRLAHPCSGGAQPAAALELVFFDGNGSYLASVFAMPYATVAVVPAADGAQPGGAPALYALDDDPVAPLRAADLEWKPGRVVAGRILPPLPDLPLARLPRECLGLVTGPPAAGNLVEHFSLAATGRVEVQSLQHLLVNFGADEDPADFAYLLDLLAAARPASDSDLAGTPAEFYDNPWMVVRFLPGGQYEPTDLWVGLNAQGVFWADKMDQLPPDHFYLMTPELETFVQNLAESRAWAVSPGRPVQLPQGRDEALPGFFPPPGLAL